MMPPNPSGISDAAYRNAVLIILSAAAVLRFWDLGGPSLWFDEVVYAVNSRGNFSDVISLTRSNNSSPVLLPLLLNLIERTVGLNEFTARLPSTLFGIASVFVMTRLKDVGVGKVVALTSAALLAVGQMQIIYAQEVREYGLSILMSALLLWSMFRVLHTGRALALLIVLAITPWASYGPCFGGLAVLTTLGILRVMKRTGLPYWKIALAGAVFLASAAASYFAIAQYQLGTAHQWYLFEHYFKLSGLGLPEWLVTNSGGILLSSVPGLLAVVVLPVVMVIFLGRYLTKPFTLLDHPGIVVAIVLIGGMILAGLLELYPYGSPRHSVFTGPFLCLMFAIGLNGFIMSLAPVRRVPVAAGLGGVVALSSLLTILAIPIAPGLHPALAKVGKLEIYGEYEDNRALMEFARSHPDKFLYGTPGASPAHIYYGADLDMVIPGRDLIGNHDAMARDIIAQSGKRPTVIVMSNLIDGHAEALKASLEAYGARVIETFTAKRVEGFIVEESSGGKLGGGGV